MNTIDPVQIPPAVPPASRRRIARWLSPRYSGLRLVGLTPSEEFLDRLEPENARLLAQFFTDLRVRHGLAMAAEGATDDPRIGEIFRLAAHAPETMTWRDAYEAEMRIALLTRGEVLRGELARRRAELKRMAPEREAELATELDRFAGAGAQDDAAGRFLLQKLLSDLHWKYAQRMFARRLGSLYTSRVTVMMPICAVVAALTVWLAEHVLRGFAPGGLGIAAASGLMGAIFFMLVTQRDATAEPSLEDLRTRFGNPMMFLRLGAGVVSATILYFVFGAEVLGDQFFPNLAGIGLESLARAGADPTRSAGFAPNGELALLVTYAFLGGYAERFVTGVLDSVQAARREPKAKPEPVKS